MTIGMIATIGGIALAAAFARDRFLGLLDRTEGWRHRLGTILEVGGSVLVLGFGVWMLVSALAA
jgi:ABC-type nickel/cobalt efflux system permease component RcnA